MQGSNRRDERRHSPGRERETNQQFARVESEIKILENRIRELESKKVSHSDLTTDNHDLRGKINFSRDPRIAGETLTDIISSTQSVTRAGLSGFGRTWNRVTSPLDTPLYPFSDVRSRGTFTVACVYGGDIYISTDGSNSFSGFNKIGDWNSVAVSADGQVIIALEDTGHYTLTKDGGSTWTCSSELDDYDWATVDLSDDGSVIVVTGVLYEEGPAPIHWSKDTGDCWHDAMSVHSYRVRVSPDGSVVYLGTTDGQMIRGIDDDGFTFSSVLSGFSLINDFDFFGNAFMIGTENLDENPNFFWTTEGLPNNVSDFYSQTLSTAPYYICMFNDGLSGIITTYDGPSFLTNDHGYSLKEITELLNPYDGDDQYLIPAATRNGTLTIFGTQGFGYVSRDGGVNFAQNPSIYDSGRDPQAIFQMASKPFILTGGNQAYLSSFGNLFSSENLGVFRNKLLVDFFVTPFISGDSYTTDDISSFLLAGQGYVLLKRGTSNWKIIRNDYNTYVDAKFVSGGSCILIMTQDFGFMRSYDDGTTWEYDSDYSTGYDLGLGLYPNLVNGDSHFIYTGFQGQNKTPIVRLKVFGGLFYDLGNYAGSVSVSAPAGTSESNNFIYSVDKVLYSVNPNFGTLSSSSVTTLYTFASAVVSIASDGSDKFIVGLENNDVFISTDEGSTWPNTFTFDENISRVYYNGNSSYPSFWVLGTGGQILTSTDRETWSDPFRVQRSINQWAPSGDLAASPDGRIRLFVSPIGISCITTNGGASWSYLSELMQYSAICAAVSASGKHLYIATAAAECEDSLVLRSSDSGKCWKIVCKFPTNILPTSLTCSSDGKYVAITESRGVVYNSQNYGQKFSGHDLNALALGTNPFFNNMNNNSEFQQITEVTQLLMSATGRIQKVYSVDGLKFSSYDCGTTWTYEGYLGINVLYAAMSQDARRITLSVMQGPFWTDPVLQKLHMGYMLETFYPGRFGLIASEDHGKCFDYCPGSSDSQHPVYNIAMTPDGQLQLALSRGQVYVSKNYASEFKLEANNEMNLMNWINTLHVLDNGKLILAAGLAGNVLECRSFELSSQVNYEVSDTQKSQFAIESNRELSNSFDLYQLDTSGGSYDCNLPRISSLYPLRTRVIRFIDLFGNCEKAPVTLKCNVEDRILVPGTGLTDSVSMEANYGYLELTSNGDNIWIVTVASPVRPPK